jgi:hypothetical protein
MGAKPVVLESTEAAVASHAWKGGESDPKWEYRQKANTRPPPLPALMLNFLDTGC